MLTRALLVLGLASWLGSADAATVYQSELYLTGVVAQPSGHHWLLLSTHTGDPFLFPAASAGCNNLTRGVILETPGNPGASQVMQAAIALRVQGARPVAIIYDTTCVEIEPGSGIFSPQIRALYL